MSMYIVIAGIVVAIIALAAWMLRERKLDEDYDVAPTPKQAPESDPPPDYHEFISEAEWRAMNPAVNNTKAGYMAFKMGRPLTDAELIALDPRWDLTRPQKD